MHASNQLSTAHFFYAMVLTATAVSLFGMTGILVAAVVAGVWWQVIAGAIREQQNVESVHGAVEQAEQVLPSSSERRAFTRIELVAAALLVALLFGVMMPPVSDFDAMQQAKNSMQQIARAVAEYEAKNGCKLAPVVYRNGKPMHSWRVLILSELGEKRLAAAYRLNEPWDSPNNIALSDFRPWHYQPFYPDVLADPSSDRSTTFVHLLSGTNTEASGAVIEHESCPTNWLAPVEFSPDEYLLDVVPDLDRGFWQPGVLASEYRGRVVARGGEVRPIHPGAQIDALPNAESLSSCDLGRPVVRYHITQLMRTILFVVVALYPLRWLREIRSEHS
ncbi:MAG: hypothetical protein Aurels2KO_15070 [Aureliella sp.]